MLSNRVRKDIRDIEVESERKKSKVLVMEMEGVAPNVEVEMNGEIMEVVSSFKYLGSCFSKDRESQDDVKIELR